MFDLGFSELIVCFVIALVVLGPARMKGLVGQIGRWVGKARTMARQFREQLETEINLDELNKATEKRAQEAQSTTPAPPPAISGDPVSTPTPPETDADKLALSGYPYGVAQAAPDAVSEAAPAATLQPGDDMYSHAHGAGEAPVPETAATPDVPDGNKENHPAA